MSRPTGRTLGKALKQELERKQKDGRKGSTVELNLRCTGRKVKEPSQDGDCWGLAGGKGVVDQWVQHFRSANGKVLEPGVQQ